MTMSDAVKLRGAMLCPAADSPGWELRPDAVAIIDAQGSFVCIRDAPEDCVAPETIPGAVWLPGFVDTHVHFPQTRILGSASGPLLPWLERSVFPEEARFADTGYAAEVARDFCQALLRQGTTCASIFSSSHPGATEELFREMARVGLRGDVGLTLMDRGAPPEVLLPVQEAMAACEDLVQRWHGAKGDLLRFCVTPRFALSCTPEMLRAAGELAQRHRLPIQTHISENPDEITATAEVFPEAPHYLGVYQQAGLVNERSLFAHCIWLQDEEWDHIAASGCSVAHCPDSNFFLGSGAMPLHKARSRQIKVGMGSDVGAGRSFSLRRACSRGFDASRMTGSDADAAELLWLATRGGARAMNRADQIGLLKVGYQADMVAITPPRPYRDARDLCDALVYHEDHDGVQQVRVRGQIVWSARP